MKLAKSALHKIIKTVKRRRCKHEWTPPFSSGYKQCRKCKSVVKA